MRRLVTPFRLGVFTALVLIVAGITVIGSHVAADILDNTGPNGDQFGNANAYYELSNTPQVTSTTETIPFYYPHLLNVTIHINVTCNSGNGTVNVTGAGGLSTTICPSSGSNDFDIPIGKNGAGNPTGNWSSVDPDTGYYEYDVTVKLPGGNSATNFKAFKFTAGNGGSVNDDMLIGYSATNNSSFTVANVNRCDSAGDPGCGKYSDYTLPYAVPCGYSGNGTQHVTLLDPDNDGSGAFPVDSSDRYNIQPGQRFSISVKYEAPNDTSFTTMSQSDITSLGTHGNITLTPTPSSGNFVTNGVSIDIAFPAKAGYRYQFVMKNVYSNNVIQFHLPYDSIKYREQCTQGDFSPSVGCDGLSGYMYDKFDNTAIVNYYIVINPNPGDAEASYASDAEINADLDVYKSALANDSTPKTDTGKNGHGFTVALPSTNSHGYNGPWVANTFYLYAREQGTSVVRQIDKLNQGKCATTNCINTAFAPNVVNQPITFTVSMQSNNYGGNPLPDGDFTVNISGPAGGVSNPVRTPNATWVTSTNTVVSDPMSFTPLVAGNYSVSWTWNGVGSGGCPSNGKAGYAPWLSVVGGNISAGANVGNGSCATEDPEQIQSWNNNDTSTPNFFGAGSTAGALATGNITNFVSGLGFNGGANVSSQAGHLLSFANNDGSGSYVVPSQYGSSYGTGTPLPCVPDYYSQLPAGATAVGVTYGSANLPTTPGTYNLSANTAQASNFNLTFGDASGSTLTLQPGVTINMYVYGTVYITSNIKYNYTSLQNIPRFNLYVKGAIYIDPNVTELHGVYVAQKRDATYGGHIATCEDGPGGSHDTQIFGNCNKPLKFVGAVMAEKTLQLMRTYGSLVANPVNCSPGPGCVAAAPAETFVYSPELWLNAPSTGSLESQAYTSLPPIL